MDGPESEVLSTIHTLFLDDGKAVVVLAGTVDSNARAALDDALARATAPSLDELVVDLSGTTALDSVALGALVRAGKRMTAGGGRIVFTGANREISRIFEITGFDRVFSVESR